MQGHSRQILISLCSIRLLITLCLPEKSRCRRSDLRSECLARRKCLRYIFKVGNPCYYKMPAIGQQYLWILFNKKHRLLSTETRLITWEKDHWNISLYRCILQIKADGTHLPNDILYYENIANRFSDFNLSASARDNLTKLYHSSNSSPNNSKLCLFYLAIEVDLVNQG